MQLGKILTYKHDMGTACSTCRRTVIDIIPDRDLLMHYVDALVAIEEKLRKGEELNKREVTTRQAGVKIVKAIKKSGWRDGATGTSIFT